MMLLRSHPLPLRVILQFLATIGVLWFLTRTFPQYISITGTAMALPTVAALLVLMNLFVRPIINILTLPLKLFMTIVAIILSNALFLWVLQTIADQFDPATVTIDIRGGIGGWVVVSLLLGITNWLLHHIV